MGGGKGGKGVVEKLGKRCWGSWERSGGKGGKGVVGKVGKGW